MSTAWSPTRFVSSCTSGTSPICHPKNCRTQPRKPTRCLPSKPAVANHTPNVPVGCQQAPIILFDVHITPPHKQRTPSPPPPPALFLLMPPSRRKCVFRSVTTPHVPQLVRSDLIWSSSKREFVRRTNAMVRFGARLSTPPVNACPSTLHVTPATPLSHVLLATANRIAGDDGVLTDDDDGRSLFPADCRFGPAIRRFRANAAPQRQAGTHCIFVGAGDGHDRFPTFLITILHFRWWLPEDRHT
jgi:hypothetical protein